MAITTKPTGSELIRSLVDAINAHDANVMRAGWADDVVERFPDRTCHGQDELVAYFQELFDAVPDVRLEIRAMAEEGEHVFMRWHLTGTHTGAPFKGIAATARRIELDGTDDFTVRDGQVVENFVVYDQLDFARQSGLMPPDGSSPDRAIKGAFNAFTTVRARMQERTQR